MVIGALVVWTTVATDPFRGFGRPLAVAAGALALFALWTLAVQCLVRRARPCAASSSTARCSTCSSSSSFGLDRPQPAAAADHALRGRRGHGRGLRGRARITRALPDTFPTAEDLSTGRLSYPLYYWNALGLMASLAGDPLRPSRPAAAREPWPVRVLAAAALPAVGATALLSFSRGGIAVGIFGVVVYVAARLARGCLVTGAARRPCRSRPWAVLKAYDAQLLHDG